MTPEHYNRFREHVERSYKSVYHEPETPNFHNRIIDDIQKNVISPLELPKEFVIADLGCGSGYWLNKMKQDGYDNLWGVTMDPEDLKECHAKGLDVVIQDYTFTDREDKTFDFIMCRHALEHSPFPIITLMEFNRMLKDTGVMYIEVPAPDTDRKHEWSPNHFSILGREMWKSLFEQTGFNLQWCSNYEFFLDDDIGNGITVQQKEVFFMFVLTKRIHVNEL